MNETKNCPYCGEEILAGAKKCKHCGEWLEDKPQSAALKPDSQVPVLPNFGPLYSKGIHLITREPKWWQKLLQMYWFNPKSWLLDELTISDDVIVVKLKNGKEFSSQLTDLKVRFQEDKYDRKEVYITNAQETIHFKEIPFMLSDDEWERLFDELESFENVGETKLNKINRLLKKSIEVGEDILG